MAAEVSHWWRLRGNDAARSIFAWAERLRTRQRAEAILDRLHEAIYEGRPLGAAGDHPAMRHLVATKSAPANLNVARSMVDTVTARLTKRRPMPILSADDAEWSEKLMAKRASRVIRRKVGGRVIERLRPDVVRACVVRGTGVGKVFRDGGDVCVEHIPRHEVLCDPVEARYGAPRTMAVVKQVNRDVLAESFPDAKKAIMRAQRQSRDEWSFYDDDSGWGSWDVDSLRVVEAWHLPSGVRAKDGRHVIAIEGICLCDEPWTRPRFPLAFMHWSSPIRGIWGHGLVEDLVGIQAKINDVARDFQEGLYWAGALKVFTPRASNIIKPHLRARQPAVVEHDGAAPQFVAPASVFAQYLEYLEWLIRKAYEISGISQLSASSKNTLGSNASGKALDTMYDIESDRFAPVELGQALWVCDVAQLMIDEARCIAEDDECDDPAGWITEIDWGKVDVDEGDYHLTVEPTNFLPETRAGKLSYVGELAKAGLLKQGAEQTLAMFDEPDLNRANRSMLGPYRNIERAMEDIADESVPIAECIPDDHWNLDLCLQIGMGELNYAMAERAPEPVLDRYRQWLSHVEAHQAKKRAGQAALAGPAPGMDPAAGGMPMGQPTPMPMSPEQGLSVPGLGPVMA
jgi:hypothetical protein